MTTYIFSSPLLPQPSAAASSGTAPTTSAAGIDPTAKRENKIQTELLNPQKNYVKSSQACLHLMTQSTTPSVFAYYRRILHFLSEVGRQVERRQQDPAVLFDQLGEVDKERVLLAQEVKLVVPLLVGDNIGEGKFIRNPTIHVLLNSKE